MRGGSIGFPVVLILFGTFWLARNLFPDLYWLRELHLFWPVLLIVWGVLLLGRRTGGWRQL
ncbi:MAG TPA: DUF5668 domain-containing protein [Bryobacteraceae bacterium]|nr:DUF5668 domain-containing protein [Bryobacteraceae bacterium]